jgi:hypothetical protein
MPGTTPLGRGRPINTSDQPTVAEELAEDSLRDLGMDWTEPADWYAEPRWLR